MNEFNIDEEQPDEGWEKFKKLLYLICAIIVISILVVLKYC